jgi:hypothetical protein
LRIAEIKEALNAGGIRSDGRPAQKIRGGQDRVVLAWLAEQSELEQPPDQHRVGKSRRLRRSKVEGQGVRFRVAHTAIFQHLEIVSPWCQPIDEQMLGIVHQTLAARDKRVVVRVE